MNEARFKWFIIVWWLSAILGIIATFIEDRFLPAELISFRTAQANSEPTVFDWIGITLAVPLFIALIIGSIGLYRLKAWGKMTFVVVNVLGLTLSPFFGPSVMSELTSGVWYFHSLLTGGLLFSLFLPPMNEVFAKGS